MIKLISLMKRADGMSREDFAHWAVEEHAQIGRRLPNIRQYRVNVVSADQPEGEFDGAFELVFDDVAALDAALGSPTGLQARDDALAHAAKRIHLRTEEHAIVAGK